MKHERSPRSGFVATATAVSAATVGLMGWSAAHAAPAGGYADLVERVSPAVVFVEVTSEQPETAEGVLPFPEGNPLEDFFERFGIPVPEGMPAPDGGGRGQPSIGVGSGFIIDPEGYIVTNNHVVANAEEVTVTLGDGRTFTADVVGTDPLTDLALLDIESDEDLPFVSFGDSTTVRPGDNVVAVGNPFGLGGTVTAGIVSAISRDINAGPYDDFIQIDAPINRGNSGGPLFNEAGEVIGVNSMIFSPSGGSVGIGFAVPANIAENVISQLEQGGAVERGWLGVQIQAVTPDLADALDLPSEDGALVSAVTPDSPADQAGIQSGDVIRSFAGTEIDEMRDLPRLVAGTAPGEDAELGILRDGTETTVTVAIEPLDPEQLASARGGDAEGQEEQPSKETNAPMLGLSIAPLDEESRALAGVEEDATGVVVVEVDEDGPAANEIRAGDVITEIDGQPVESPEEVTEVLGENSEGAVLLKVQRDGSERFVAVRPDAA